MLIGREMNFKQFKQVELAKTILNRSLSIIRTEAVKLGIIVDISIELADEFPYFVKYGSISNPSYRDILITVKYSKTIRNRQPIAGVISQRAPTIAQNWLENVGSDIIQEIKSEIIGYSVEIEIPEEKESPIRIQELSRELGERNFG